MELIDRLMVARPLLSIVTILSIHLYLPLIRSNMQCKFGKWRTYPKLQERSAFGGSKIASRFECTISVFTYRFYLVTKALYLQQILSMYGQKFAKPDNMHHLHI